MNMSVFGFDRKSTFKWPNIFCP